MLFNKNFYPPLCLGLLLVIVVFKSCKPPSPKDTHRLSEIPSVRFANLLASPDSIQTHTISSYSETLRKGIFAYQQALRSNASLDSKSIIETLHRAARYFHQIPYTEGLGYTYALLAEQYASSLQSDSVLLNYNLAIENFALVPDTFLMMRMYNNMGNYMSELGNNPLALNYYLNAQNLTSSPSKMGAITLFNIATLYSSTGKYTESKAIFSKLLRDNKILDSLFVSDIYNNLAAIDLLLDQPHNALHYLGLSEKFQPDTSFTSNQTRIVNKASAYFQIKNYTQGHYNLQLLSNQFQLLTSENKRYYYLLQIYANPNVNEAHLERYLQYSDSIQQSAFSQKLIELKRNFELKEQQALIEFLETNNHVQSRQLRLLHQTLITICVLLAATALFIFLLMWQRKKLHQSQKALNQALKIKDRVLSIIGHDLRGPMGSMKELFEVFLHQKNWSTDDLNRLLSVARDSSSSTYYLLENLLTWANSLNGKISFKPQVYLLPDLVQESVNPLESWADLKAIRLHTQTAPFHIDVDRNMFGTILRNLISNAIKFSPFQSVITLKTTETPTEHLICISDEGPGMSQDQIAQLNHSEPQEPEDMEVNFSQGLGLVLCKEFTLQHGGRIWAEANAPIGTTVWLSFPKTARIPIPAKGQLAPELQC